MLVREGEGERGSRRKGGDRYIPWSIRILIWGMVNKEG